MSLVNGSSYCIFCIIIESEWMFGFGVQILLHILFRLHRDICDSVRRSGIGCRVSGGISLFSTKNNVHFANSHWWQIIIIINFMIDSRLVYRCSFVSLFPLPFVCFLCLLCIYAFVYLNIKHACMRQGNFIFGILILNSR